MTEEAEGKGAGIDVVSAILGSLGIGLSRLLRYTFPSFLLLGLAYAVSPSETICVLRDTPWPATVAALLLAGVGLYGVHRAIVIPIHAFIGTLFLGMCGGDGESLSPTRWLNHLGVRRFHRIAVYNLLKRRVLSKKEREDLSVLHAELGLVVMISETLFAAAYLNKGPFDRCTLFSLGAACFVGSYLGAAEVHKVECAMFRTKRYEIQGMLKDAGLIDEAKTAKL